MKFRRLLLLFIVAVSVAVFTFLGSKHLWMQPLASLDSSQVYVIKSGATIHGVSKKFKEKGITQYAWSMALGARLFNPSAVFKVGEYRLPAQASLSDVVAIFDRGVGLQHKITLIEGVDCFQLVDGLQDFFDSSQAREAVLDRAQTCASLSSLLSEEAVKLMDGGRHPEGWFLPETYYFPSGVDVNSVLVRAHEAMLKVLKELWPGRDSDLPYHSLYDVLKMASIVERETGVASERAQIAGVFVRRIRQGMRLQTDPTVIYGLGANYSGNLSRSDLKNDMPYNTYTRGGLPPSPIAMPGREAIYAALHPAQGDALYFVAKGDGSHHFSATLEEHRAAVQKYQINQRRADYRSSPNKT